MTGKTLHPSYDVIIIGARCAGASTALLLARQGLRVLVVDKSRHGSDILSTHALMRGGVLQLQRWGVLDAVRAAGTPPVSTTTFHYLEESIEVVIKPRDGVDALYAPRRTVLDPILAEAAVEAGAEVLRGARLVDLIRDTEDRIRGVVIEDLPGQYQRISADLVIGADGVRSTVARLVSPTVIRWGAHAAAVVYGYWEDLDLEGYHWHFGPGVSAGAIATNGGTLVFAGVPRDRFMNEIRFNPREGFFRILRETAPDLADAVGAARQSGGFRSYAGQPGYLRQTHGPGWALVGDATYFKDPITAHGITDALRDAELLSRAVRTATEDGWTSYQETGNVLSLELFELTDTIASFAWNLDELKQLHKQMSDEMRREVEYLVRLHEEVPATPAADPRRLLTKAG